MNIPLRILVLLITGLLNTIPVYAQAPQHSLEHLHFLEGEWEGTGWILGQDRIRHSFHQSEVIQPKADYQALMVDGLGHAIDSTGTITDRVIHNAFGIISYNEDRDTITMITFSEMNGRMESDIVFLDERKLQWSFKAENGAIIRFTEDFSKEDSWNETGHISMNGEDWYPFFEMNLTRQ